MGADTVNVDPAVLPGQAMPRRCTGRPAQIQSSRREDEGARQTGTEITGISRQAAELAQCAPTATEPCVSDWGCTG